MKITISIDYYERGRRWSAQEEYEAGGEVQKLIRWAGFKLGRVTAPRSLLDQLRDQEDSDELR